MKRKLTAGFTLMEMMVVIAIIGIIAGIGIPSYNMFSKNSRLAGASEELLNSLSLAKSEAVKRGMRVTVCNTANPTADTPTCTAAGSEDWRTGWIVFVDADASNSYTAGEEILRVTHALGKLDSATASGVAAISFRSTIGPGNTETVITLCNQGATARQVTVDRLGRISRKQGSQCS